jgi:hypothetical protein
MCPKRACRQWGSVTVTCQSLSTRMCTQRRVHQALLFCGLTNIFWLLRSVARLWGGVNDWLSWARGRIWLGISGLRSIAWLRGISLCRGRIICGRGGVNSRRRGACVYNRLWCRLGDYDSCLSVLSRKRSSIC